MAISLPAGSGSARNLASRSRQKAEFVSIAPFAIHQEVRLRPVHDTGARRLSKHITTRVAPSAGGTWSVRCLLLPRVDSSFVLSQKATTLGHWNCRTAKRPAIALVGRRTDEDPPARLLLPGGRPRCCPARKRTPIPAKGDGGSQPR